MRGFVVAGALLCACNEPGPSQSGSANACARTAERLASFEMGNASTNRVPVVAKHRTACETAKLTDGEHACIANAKDTWAAISCAPRMFPDRGSDRGSAAGTDCKLVMDRMRIAVTAQMPGDSGSAGTTMIDKMMTIMQKACTEDAWPESVRACVVGTAAGDMPALQKCNEALPKDLQDKLSARMSAEMKR